MNFIIVATVLVLACMADAEPQHVEFFIHKSSFAKVITCEKVKCVLDDGRTACIASWREFCVLKTESFRLGEEKDGAYPLIDRNGKQCDGKILKHEEKENISKFTLTNNADKHIILCGTHLEKLSDEDKKHLEEFCPEQTLKKVDQKNCAPHKN